MNEWGFIGQDIFAEIEIFVTINNFKSRRGYVLEERLVIYNPTHHGQVLNEPIFPFKTLKTKP